MALMDKHDLAARWGVGVDAVAKMITKRQCPQITWIGRNARFDPADVEVWEAEQKEKPPTAKPATPPALELVHRGHPPAGPRPTPPPPPRPMRQGMYGVSA